MNCPLPDEESQIKRWDDDTSGVHSRWKYYVKGHE